MSEVYRISYVQDSISFLIEEIVERYTFVKMLKSLSEYMTIDLLRDDCHFIGPLMYSGDFKEWVESSFIGLHRFDINRDVPNQPEDVHWYMTLRNMRFQLTQKMGIEMMVKDMDYWKGRLSSGRDKKFPFILTFNPMLDMTENIFKITAL